MILFLVLSAVVSFVLGSIVLSQQPRVAAARYFFATMVACALWGLGIAAFLAASEERYLQLAAVLYYIAAASIATWTLLFSLTFARDTPLPRYISVAALMPFLVIASALVISPSVMLTSFEISSAGNTADLQPWSYAIYTIYFFSYYATALVILLVRSGRAVASLRKHFLYILLAYTSAGVIGMLFNLFLPAYGNYQLIWAGPLGMLVFVPIVFLAIARHGLFDIGFAVVRTIAYSATLATLAGIYYLVAYVASSTLLRGEYAADGIQPTSVLLALVLAFVFQPIKSFFDKATDRIFFRNRYVAEDFYSNISSIVSRTTDLRGLLNHVAQEVGDTFKADQAFFFVRYDNSTRYVSSGTPGHSLVSPASVGAIDQYVKTNGNAVIVADLLLEGQSDLKQLLVSHHIALAIPLLQKGSVLGYLFMGGRRSSNYTSRDLRVLRSATNELIIAIQHALVVQEVKDLNANLQQRIDAATSELKTSNTRLRHLDATKDEFVSMASHQLRTPLTSVKGYLSMVLEGDAGKITDTQRHLLGEAFVSSERMVHLIHDFLNVSRLQTGKFVLERTQTDIVKLVRDEVDSLQHIARKRDMQLVLHVSGDFPLLSLDAAKLRQVVMNYIDNALFYSLDNKTPITVMLARVGEMVELRVIDSGMGVPKAEQHRLFSKFFRAENARKQRPDGTGVGLYLAKKIVTEHGGDIIFLSEEGKGSTFGFRLPIDTLASTKD